MVLKEALSFGPDPNRALTHTCFVPLLKFLFSFLLQTLLLLRGSELAPWPPRLRASLCLRPTGLWKDTATFTQSLGDAKIAFHLLTSRGKPEFSFLEDWLFPQVYKMTSKTAWPASLHSCILFFFFGHTMRLAGSQFPDQGLNPGHGSESAES